MWKNLPARAHLHCAIPVQQDVSLVLGQILVDVVGDEVGLEQEPALSPVLPLVALLHHVALQGQQVSQTGSQQVSLPNSGCIIGAS